MKLLSEIKRFAGGILGMGIERKLRERRNSPRKPCDIYGVYTYQEERTVPLVIKDIGLYGIQVHSYKKLLPGSYLLVSARSDTRVLDKRRYETSNVYMTVLWCRKNEEDYAAGLQFNDSLENIRKSWLSYLFIKYGLSGDAAAYKRRSLRVSAELPLTWRVLGGEKEHGGSVVDISLDGVLIAIDRNMSPRENLWMKIGPYKSLKPLVCKATVAHALFSRSQDQWLAGACFSGLDEEGTKLLRMYIADCYIEKN